MLRGENIVCGTSTTGTGTLTLAATPSGIGGVDFDAWLKATGVGFVSGNAVLVSYTIIEYTDATFAVAKFVEKGIGTLTLGASITAATLARTTVQTVSNANADSYQVGGGASAITIGTAANVLVFVGASAADLRMHSPYYESVLNDAAGVPPAYPQNAATGNTELLVTAKDYFMLFPWEVPMLVKKATIRVTAAYATGSPVSNAYGRLYSMGTDGRPKKLLIDFGLFGSANTSLNATGLVSTAVHANGFYLQPGVYWFDFVCILSGATTLPRLSGINASGPYWSDGRLGTASMIPNAPTATATSGTGGAAPDPANVTGYSVPGTVSTIAVFTLAPS